MLLNDFYPERTISISSRDPDWVTPEIKSMLRRKNRLMRAGRVEEAGALADRIGKEQTRHSKTQLSGAGAKTDAKDIWKAYRQLVGRRQEAGAVEGVDAESLNRHYASISTDTPHHSVNTLPTQINRSTSQNGKSFRFLTIFAPHSHRPRPPPSMVPSTGSSSVL